MTSRGYLPIKEGMFSRRRLSSLLADAVESTAVTLIAGPGYGKTQALAQFAQGYSGRVVWLHVTGLCNHVNIFWERFIQALCYELPQLASELKGMRFPENEEEYDAFLKLFSESAENGGRVLFVVDDYDAIENESVKLFFKTLLNVDIENVCMIAVSGKRTPINSISMGGNGNLLDINQTELSFTRQEISDYLTSCGYSVDRKLLDRLYEETDGWPFAVHNFCRQYNGCDVDETIFSHRKAATEFFENEYYQKYDREYQQLLVCLSQFDGFSAGVVKMLWEGDSDWAINEMQQNTFIMHDYVTGLLVMQRVFRRFLQQKLEHFSLESRRRACALAGDAFMCGGHVFYAIEAYHLSGNNDGLLHAVDNIPRTRLPTTISSHVLQYLNDLPPEYQMQHPEVYIFKAYLYMNQMEYVAAKRILHALESLLERDEIAEKRRLLSEAYGLLADISIQLNSDEFNEYFKKAAAIMPSSNEVRRHSSNYVLNSSTFFLHSYESGALEHICELYLDATPHIEYISESYGYGQEYLFMAEATMLVCDTDAAMGNAHKAVFKASEKGQLDIVCNAYFVMLRIAVLDGNLQRCQRVLEELERTAMAEGGTLVEIRESVECWFYLSVWDLQRTPAWLTSYDYEQSREFPYKCGRNLLYIANFLLKDGNFREALTMIDRLETLYGKSGLWSLRLDSYIIRAICRQRLGDREKALDALWLAYEMSHGNQIILPFIEHGNAMRSLMELARKDEQSRFDPEWINNVLLKASSYAKRHAVLLSEYDRAARRDRTSKQQLSKREAEVLGYMARGMTREEIAALMRISINGVKKHITGVYNKLGAINRADAIRIATQSGQIPPFEEV